MRWIAASRIYWIFCRFFGVWVSVCEPIMKQNTETWCHLSFCRHQFIKVHANSIDEMIYLLYYKMIRNEILEHSRWQKVWSKEKDENQIGVMRSNTLRFGSALPNTHTKNSTHKQKHTLNTKENGRWRTKQKIQQVLFTLDNTIMALADKFLVKLIWNVMKVC